MRNTVIYGMLCILQNSLCGLSPQSENLNNYEIQRFGPGFVSVFRCGEEDAYSGPLEKTNLSP
jgi:hypothetical protein